LRSGGDVLGCFVLDCGQVLDPRVVLWSTCLHDVEVFAMRAFGVFEELAPRDHVDSVGAQSLFLALRGGLKPYV
jgi:hypothetical protein